MSYRADLHCHSNCSDGTFTPKELLHLAKEAGLDALSITDHDTLRSYCPSLFEEAKALGLALFMGVEFSARHHGTPIHLLGYGVAKEREILAFCQEHQKRRHERNQAILKKLALKSILIEEEELGDPEEQTLGRPHIAKILRSRKIVSSYQEAFDRYLGEGKPCFDPGESFGVEETIEIIHRAGGKAFIAHPHLIRNQAVFKELLKMPFDGIECYSGRHPNKEKKWLLIASQKNWLISGGSDFHGSSKPYIPLGCSWVGEEEVNRLFGDPG